MTDRGLRSPILWKKIIELKWHPLMRRRVDAVFRIESGMRMPARRLVSGPGNAFAARGTPFRAESKRTKGTIIVIRVEGRNEPWIVLTDIAPSEAGASWRSLRFR